MKYYRDIVQYEQYNMKMKDCCLRYVHNFKNNLNHAW